MQAMISTAVPVPSPTSSGVRLVATDGRELAFRGATVHVRAQGGLAVVVLTQRFANAHAEPLSVRYTMPLPADAAVRGYSFLLGGKLIRGEVDRKHRARERFEEAVAAGRTAGLVEQERSSVFTQELGNIPPGEELVAMLELDQKLEWLDDGQWSWRFPTVVGPRYLGAEGRVQDAAQVTVEVAETPRPRAPGVELVLHVLDAIEGEITSPTHALAVSPGGGAGSNLAREASRREGAEVNLAHEARLDRDIAVRWPVAQPRVGLALQAARPEERTATGRDAFGLLTVVPPAPTARPRALPRDLIFLLDASGSMYGAPMQQARALMRSLIHTLEDTDQLELISFGDRPHRWKRGATKATKAAKQEALAWVERLQAEGGTEMRSGILEALAPLRPGAQRQVILITDGLIGFESEIVATLQEKLPPGCRLHTVGVGSSVNRSLTGPAARAGHGVEVIVDLDGDVHEATRRLLARTCAPLVTELVLEGDALLDHAPAKLPDLFAGAPALLSLRLKPGGGALRLRGMTAAGPWSEEITVPARQPGEGSPSLAALYGRERVEDLEALRAMGRDQGRLDQEIERTGLDFQIATRLTSWVAITEKRTVDPEAKRRAENVPQELPHGMNAAALGLRAPSSVAAVTGKLGAPVMILEADEQMAPGQPPMTRTLDDDLDEAGDRLASPSKRGQEDSGALFALKELMSLEEPRIYVEEIQNAPAPGAAAPRLAAPMAPMPAPSSTIDLKARIGRRSEAKELPAPSMSADKFQDRGEPQDRPSMPLQGMPLPSIPPEAYAPRSARKSRALWLALGMLLLLIAALVYWFFLRR